MEEKCMATEDVDFSVDFKAMDQFGDRDLTWDALVVC